MFPLQQMIYKGLIFNDIRQRIQANNDGSQDFKLKPSIQVLVKSSDDQLLLAYHLDHNNGGIQKQGPIFFRKLHFQVVVVGKVFSFKGLRKFFLHSHGISDAYVKIQTWLIIDQVHVFSIKVSWQVYIREGNHQKRNVGFQERTYFSRVYMINYQISQLYF